MTERKHCDCFVYGTMLVATKSKNQTSSAMNQPYLPWVSTNPFFYQIILQRLAIKPSLEPNFTPIQMILACRPFLEIFPWSISQRR